MGNNTQFPSSVFKAYDIRGTVPDLIDARFARALGVSLAARARDQGVQTLVVGRDGRLSSEMLSVALQEGMLEGGVDTLDIGMVPTPLVYFAANVMQTGSGVAITGSHNPPKYNGFKMMMGGRALYGEDVQALAASMNGPASAPAARPGV
ncbi:MAG TPA: phosphomannomutase/phosphoglucomutase, partial [Achromobacter sp.]